MVILSLGSNLKGIREKTEEDKPLFADEEDSVKQPRHSCGFNEF